MLNPPESDLIKEINFENPDEFLKSITTVDQCLPKESVFTPNRWIFRGVSDSRYELIPKAFRPSHREELLQMSGRDRWPEQDLETTQIYLEYNVLFRFYKTLERQGLTVPDNSPELRNFFEHPARLVKFLYQAANDGVVWPPSMILGLMGLAQHYALPTRLLDWSYDPLVAAYFASRQQSSAESIAVWCLDTALLVNAKSTIAIAYAASASNPNLRAQRGLFTVSGVSFTNNDWLRKCNLQPLEMRVRELSPMPGNPAIYKFSLGSDGAAMLGAILASLGYSWSRLFPDYEGVATEVKGTTVKLSPWGPYECRTCIFVPVNIVGLASAIAALIDPDTGGHRTFESGLALSPSGEDPPTHMATESAAPCELVHALRDLAQHLPGLKYVIYNDNCVLADNIDAKLSGRPHIHEVAGYFGLKVIPR